MGETLGWMTYSAVFERYPNLHVICTEGYAAGTLSNGTKFIVKSTDGKWATLGQDPCGSASAGLPSAILQDGCGG